MAEETEELMKCDPPTCRWTLAGNPKFVGLPQPASRAECVRSAVAEFGIKVRARRRELVEGSWPHIPPGCSVQGSEGQGARIAARAAHEAASIAALEAKEEAASIAALKAKDAAAKKEAAKEEAKEEA